MRSPPSSRAAPGASRNLLADHGEAGLAPFRARLSRARRLSNTTPSSISSDARRCAISSSCTNGTSPGSSRRIGRLRGAARASRCCSTTRITAPSAIPRRSATSISTAMTACWLSARRWREVYRRWGWGDRVFVWHEAADTRLFRPPSEEATRGGPRLDRQLGRRRARPRARSVPAAARAAQAGLPLDIHGVRYPRQALATLARHGARYRGWLAERARARRFRPAPRDRACAATLLCRGVAGHPDHPRLRGARLRHSAVCRRPGSDAEGLFREGEDYLLARDRSRNGRAYAGASRMTAISRPSLATNGLETIRARHSCAHRAAELADIVSRLDIRRDAGGCRSEDRLLWLEPAFVILERRRHVLSRAPAPISRGAVTTSSFTSPMLSIVKSTRHGSP